MGKGTCGEFLVYAGACNRATIINEYSRGNDNVMSNMPKLQVVEELKNLPLEANVYQFYTAGGLVLMTDNVKRSENRMEKYRVILEEFKIQSEKELKDKLIEGENKAIKLEEKEIELAQKVDEIETLTNENSQLKEDLIAKDDEISKLEKDINDLTKLNEELKINEELIETYKKDLKDEIIELGIRSQGNAFNKTLFERFLSTLSIEELKEVKSGFNEEVLNKFSGARTTQTKVDSRRKDGEELYKEDFETEEEVRE